MSGDREILLGVDIGGTKISYCYFDRDYRLIDKKATDTGSLPQGKDFFLELEKRIRDYMQPNVKLLGISVKGMVKDGVITYSPLSGGVTFYPAESRLKRLFNVSVLADNDVNCMARAESYFGFGRNCQSFVLVNLGTGLRVSFYSERLMMRGYRNRLGEVTYEKVFVPEFAREIELGKIVSGRGLGLIYKEISGGEKQPVEIFEGSVSEPFCRQSVEVFVRYLAHLFSQVSIFYNPQRIVVNGSLKFSFGKFLSEAKSIYRETTKKELLCSGIFVSKLDEAGALGSVIG